MDQINDLELEVRECCLLTGMADYNLHAHKVGQVTQRLEEMRERLANLNRREKLLNQEATEYLKLRVVAGQFEPVQQLWQTILSYFLEKHDWENTSLALLSYDKICRLISDEYVRGTARLLKHFGGLKMVEPTSVCQEFRAEVERFQEKTWIL